MQQELAFYQRLLLLMVLEIFNFSVFHVRTVFYAPPIHIQAFNGIK
jgi:hypothetical protein